MRGSHQRQDRGIARGLTQGGAQINDRIAGAVFVNQPGRAQLQRLDLRGIFGQHLFDAGAGTDAVVGGRQHPGQHGLDAPGLIAGFRGVQHGFHRGHGLGLTAALKIQRRIQRAVKVGIGLALIRRDQLVQFGLGCIRTAGGLQKLNHRDMAFHRSGQIACQLAQEGFGAVDVALGHVPGDQGTAHLGVVGKAFDHDLKLRAGACGIARLRQNAQLCAVHIQRRRVQRQRAVNLGQGGLRVGGRGQVINQHAQGDAAVGGRGQDGAGLFGRLGAGGRIAVQHGLTVAQRQGYGAHAGGIGGQPDRLGAVAFSLGPVATGDGQFSQSLAYVGGVGILLDQAQILAISLLHIALFQDCIGIGFAGFLVKAVVFEDIAEFHQGAVGVSGLQQGQPRRIIVFGLFL